MENLLRSLSLSWNDKICMLLKPLLGLFNIIFEHLSWFIGLTEKKIFMFKFLILMNFCFHMIFIFIFHFNNLLYYYGNGEFDWTRSRSNSWIFNGLFFYSIYICMYIWFKPIFLVGIWRYNCRTFPYWVKWLVNLLILLLKFFLILWILFNLSNLLQFMVEFIQMLVLWQNMLL